ncbi:hypothetical protein WOLCODRAFT_158067 [Wolfiporia cocos MD-104 SS10]|uniref:Uncharacterized protein n=1 Tax=Wolfiporia cocos (strain MD-104) TaxID=742152 RepID=A0A2H3J530_WOLCO|nr:hypothetical protein WOLCODRAFT_158067 [Wolfiporia cocos MD-104 SS10]
MQARGVPAPPRAPSLQTTAHGGADRLTNRALGLDDPQQHPAPHAYPQGRTNVRGIASAPAPVSAGQPLRSHTGNARSGVKHNQKGPDKDGKDAKAPKATGHPSPYAHPAGPLRQRQGHPGQQSRTSGRPYGKGNRPSHTTQPQATATSPPAYQTQERATAHSRQGNPPRTKSNSGAAALPNAPPLPPTASTPGCAAGTPQGSEVARGADTLKTPL